MSNSQRRKGAAGEREICKILRDSWGVDADRNLDQSREGGCDVPCPPFCIEVKRRAAIGNIYQWMNQAIASCETPVDVPVVACRADGKKWLVILRLEDFLTLAREELSGCELLTGRK